MARKHKVATVEDLPEDGARVLADVDGVEVAVFRIDGQYHALANYCIHQGGPLCEGDLTGRVTMDREAWEWRYDPAETAILCPWHGWQFDVATGESLDAAGYAVPTYDVAVEDDDVFVLR